MKTKFLCLLGASLLFTMTGCVVHEREYRGGYYDRQEYGRGTYYYHTPRPSTYPYHRDSDDWRWRHDRYYYRY